MSEKLHPIVEKVANMLNEEKWTRTEIRAYNKKKFMELDRIIEEAKSNGVIQDLRKLCRDYIKNNTNSMIALYILGILAYEYSITTEEYIPRIIETFIENEKWTLVEYLASKIIMYKEKDAKAYNYLAYYYEHTGMKEELYEVWQKLVSIDVNASDIAKKLADEYEKEGNEKSAIYYYKIAIRRFAYQKRLSLVRQIWEKLVKYIPDDYELFFSIEKIISSHEIPENIAAMLFLLADHAMKSEDWDSAIKVLKRIAKYTPRDKSVREMLVKAYKKKYKEHSMFDYYLRLSALEKQWKDINEAIEFFEKRIVFDKGFYLQHASWGIGKIVNIDEQYIYIDFKHKKNHRMNLNMALRSTKILPKDHLYVKKYEDIDALKRLAEEDPKELLKIVLKSRSGNQASGKEIKADLVPDIIPQEKWQKWWTKARKLMKNDMHFSIGLAKKDSYIYREKSIPYEEEMYSKFEATKSFNDKVSILESFIKNHGNTKTPEFDKMVEYFISKINEVKGKEITSEAVISYMLIKGINKILTDKEIKLPISDNEIVKSLPDPVSVFWELPYADQKKEFALILIKNYNNWESVFKEILIKGNARLNRFIIEKLLLYNKYHIIKEAIKKIIENYRKEREVFIWLVQSYFSTEDSISDFKDIADEFVDDIVIHSIVLIDQLERDIESKENISANKKYYSILEDVLFTQGVIIKYIENIDLVRAQRIYNAVIHLTNIDNAKKTYIKNAITKKFPEIISEEEKLATYKNKFWTTIKSLENKKRELADILNVQIPANSREIGEAMEKGDLRENAEYKAAIERQQHLKAMAAKLQQEIANAQIIDENNIDTSRVSIGTQVKLLDLESNQEIVYKILGEWESDISKNIISYTSPLGSVLIGKTTDEEVEFEFGDQKKKYKILSIEKIDFSSI